MPAHDQSPSWVRDKGYRRRIDLLAKSPFRVPITWAYVGVQKCGTTDMYAAVTQHRMVAAGFQKELRFFVHEDRPWEEPDYREYCRPTMRPDIISAGDATPAYFYFPHALERLRRYKPDMPLILSVRDPIERAVSQWAMERNRQRKVPDLPDTVEAWLSPTLPQEIPASMSEADFGRRGLYHRGLYGQQLRRGLQHFARDQWLILDARDTQKDFEGSLARIVEHLGLPPFQEYPPQVNSKNEQTRLHGARLRPEHVARMVTCFAEDLSLFVELSGHDISHWPTKRVIEGSLSAAELAERMNAKIGLA